MVSYLLQSPVKKKEENNTHIRWCWSWHFVRFLWEGSNSSTLFRLPFPFTFAFLPILSPSFSLLLPFNPFCSSFAKLFAISTNHYVSFTHATFLRPSLSLIYLNFFYLIPSYTPLSCFLLLTPSLLSLWHSNLYREPLHSLWPFRINKFSAFHLTIL